LTGKFFFDGVPSKSLGVYIINIGTSDDNMPLFGGQTITNQSVIEHDYSTFIKTNKENIRLTMHFSLCDVDGIESNETFTPTRLNSISKFFMRSIPIEFMAEEDTTKVIKIVPTSSVEVVRFGEMKGYFQITFQATTPYWLTPLEVLTFNLTSGGTQSFSVFNRRNIQDKHGNYDVYPKLIIRNMAATNNFILSNTTSGKQVAFTNIPSNERIDMHHRIVNAQISPHIFHNWNKQPFYLTENQNNLSVSSNCILEIHVQYPTF